jgi:predicted RNase H-like HicB family nuclease
MKYAVVIETGETSYGDYVPDLPGFVAVDEVRTLIQEAIAFYLKTLDEDGMLIPQPRILCEYLEPLSA